MPQSKGEKPTLSFFGILQRLASLPPSFPPLSHSPVLTSFVLATGGKTWPGIFDPVNRMDKKNRGRLARDESGVGERAEKERAKGRRGWRAYSPIKT